MSKATIVADSALRISVIGVLHQEGRPVNEASVHDLLDAWLLSTDGGVVDRLTRQILDDAALDRMAED